MSDSQNLPHSQAEVSPVHWFKLPWLLLWLLPGTAVVAGLATVFIAVKHADSMVKDDYYRQGLAYNLQQQADQAAADMHLQAILITVNNQILLTLNGEQLPALPASLALQLSHPTDGAADQEITMTLQGPRQYGAAAPVSITASWYIQLQPADGSWRLRGRWQPGAAGVLKPEIL